MTRTCRRCSTPTKLLNGYCSACNARLKRATRERIASGTARAYHREAADHSRPPPPPPGFDPRDLLTGRPVL